MTQLVSFLGGTIVGESHGALDAGVSVLALHGWARSRKDFQPLLSSVAGTVAVDLPGFGSSPLPGRAWGSREYAQRLGEAVTPLVEQHGPLVLVGHSFGGRIATCLAADRPELVRGLLLVGVPLLRRDPSKPSVTFRIARAANRCGIYSDSRMERLRFKRGSNDYRSASGVMREILVRVVNEQYEDELGQIVCPTSLLWGSRDSAAPLEQAQEACKLVKNLAEFMVIEDAGHDVHLSHFPDLSALLADLQRDSE